ncbi:cobalt-zinc-cadmium efflux system protein [Streptosporangium becharense]|uniref:Cobalt-zinc-cadmium efflux system protein n=1 Tax=Streptosporangium becharense TaxID=1816182 RepID=A0A7W9IKP8_9ACTN|nr:cation diffusion facilitator family transporter [Streptosporangium becharense]MBB2911672.1 cobalt-zinc-cadmium efflux system protein [Streptosporangium becharense]MBB5822510.1 cobalt-zinc-cadmium efflux system protein [Streptosporangium becharense]
MGHGHGHGHGHGANADRRHLTAALILLVGFMAAEVVVGVIANSIALISDAGHMLTDAAAIALALVAMSLAARPARGAYTFGWKRAEIISAAVNGLTFVGLVVYFVYEGVRRLVEPPEVQGVLVLVTALAGVAVNAGAAWLIARADRSSLNVEGAFQHILNDMYAFIATAVAGAVVWLTGWSRADAIAALVVAALMAKAAYDLLRDSGRILFEAAPAGANPAEVNAAIAAHPGVTGVEDLHVWTVTSGFPALSAHVTVTPGGDCHRVRRELADLLRERFRIEHTTLQVDHVPGTACRIAAS